MNKVFSVLLVIFFSTSSLGKESLDSDVESSKSNHTLVSWNRVMLEKDLELMKVLLAEGAQVSSAGMQLNGEDEVINKFQFIFNRRPDLVWVNTPIERVEFESWNSAYEYGDWKESWTQDDGKAQITGKYFILWEINAGNWEIKTAVFAPSKCTGDSSYCG